MIKKWEEDMYGKEKDKPVKKSIGGIKVKVLDDKAVIDKVFGNSKSSSQKEEKKEDPQQKFMGEETIWK